MPLLGVRAMGLVALLGCGGERAGTTASASLPDSASAVAESLADTTDSAARTPSLDQLSRLGSQRWSFDLDSLVARRVIRVLVTPNRMAYFLDGPRQRGSAYEAVQEFERELNRTLGTKTLQVECVFIPVPRDQLLSRLAEGRGDLAVGLIRPTPERRKQLDFSAPLYEGVRDIVVTGPGAPPLQRLEDLAGREVYVRPSSSAAESLRRLNQEWKARGVPEIVILPADEHLDDGDVLEMVSGGVVPITVVSEGDAQAYAPLLPTLALHRELVVDSGGSYAWALRKGTPELREAVDRFVRGHRSGTTFGNIMIQRYWQNNRWLENPTAGGGLARYQAVIGAFRASAAEFDLDPLLLLAQGYQESGLDQSRKSHAGAVGVMQVKPSTAAAPPIGISGVDRLDNNVRAGAKYLRFIIDRYYSDSTITPLDRELFAMASYNAGPARVAGLRREARDAGLDPDRWFQNVEVIAAREIGRETVDYVSNIYKYYLAYTLLAEHRASQQRAESTARQKGK
ncbi:MAG TPA: transporter substrate-binding domain-containing protein [Gemmatimonadales bacterium]|nr:transporter substrate-binding domain-containing protein [Gemmatimonadales bacterium]